LKKAQQVGGIVLCNGKTVRVQVKFTCRQFSPVFYFTFPLAFVLSKLEGRWCTLSKRFKGCNGKKKYE